jgi:hypothetical protein
MIEVIASTHVDAPAAVVWDVLTDLASYAEWNPFIRAARGTPAHGADVEVHVHTSLGIPLRFHATVLTCDEPRLLHWLGYGVRPWLASGEHWFTIEHTGAGGVRFVQREEFVGVLPQLFGWLLARETRRGFDAMNRALKQRAEARALQATASKPTAGAPDAA